MVTIPHHPVTRSQTRLQALATRNTGDRQVQRTAVVGAARSAPGLTHVQHLAACLLSQRNDLARLEQIYSRAVAREAAEA